MLAVPSQRALAWGDDGHKAIALIAEKYLEPAVKTKISAMLAADPDNLTPHDLPNEATWADKYRDSNHRKDHYDQTRNWHFVDLEITNPDSALADAGFDILSRLGPMIRRQGSSIRQLTPDRCLAGSMSATADTRAFANGDHAVELAKRNHRPPPLSAKLSAANGFAGQGAKVCPAMRRRRHGPAKS